MTAPHDTQRRGRLEVYWCPRCQVQSERLYHFCEKGAPLFPQTDVETLCERVEVAPVQSEGERFPQYVLAPDGSVTPVLAVTDEMVERGARALDDDIDELEEFWTTPRSLARAVLEAAFNCSPPTTQEARTDG